MCKKSVESIDYLLLQFDFAYNLWLLVFCLFGIHWVMPKRVLDLLACWRGGFGGHHSVDICSVFPLYIMWDYLERMKQLHV